MNRRSRARSFGLLLTCLGAVGCGSGIKSTEFLNARFDFTYVERVAVLPFENLSNDRQAGLRATRLTITELLASGAVDVVEYGEVLAALATIPGGRSGRVKVPNTEEMIALGQSLGVQAVIVGSVPQSEVIRLGGVSVPVVTLDMHMVETETGASVWAATHTEKGSSIGAKVLGVGGEPISKTTRLCVQGALKSLVN